MLEVTRRAALKRASAGAVDSSKTYRQMHVHVNLVQRDLDASCGARSRAADLKFPGHPKQQVLVAAPYRSSADKMQ